MLRKPIFAANWKMYKTKDDAVSFLYQVNLKVPNNVETIIFAPYLFLRSLTKRAEKVSIGAQNMHYLTEGAFTGEVSPLMLKTAGVDYVLLGHSERRKYFNESDEDVNLKIKASLEMGLNFIACLGESYEERNKGLTNKVLLDSLKGMLNGIKDTEADKIILAYEPIWAIGSNKSATPIQINDACKYLREQIKLLYNEDIANKVRILYGGSVNENNIEDIIELEDVDGVLVGSASLDHNKFLKMVNIISDVYKNKAK